MSERNEVVLKALLETIYCGGLNEHDFSKIILKVHEALEDSFYFKAPTKEQQLILKQLELIAGNVYGFFGR